MAIIDMFKMEKKTADLSKDFLEDMSFAGEEEISPEAKPVSLTKDQVISFLCVRLFFVVLFAIDLLWLVYGLFKMTLCLFLQICFLGFSHLLRTQLAKAYKSVRRALICGLSLFLALIAPAFGIMVACTYFLMYDKSGIDEVVPSSLKEQFKDLFSQVN